MKLIEFQQQKEIPAYLKHKSGLASHVLFSALFALLFIIIYKPFESVRWLSQAEMAKTYAWMASSAGYIMFACCIVGIGFFVLGASRTMMYFYAKHHRMFYWVYVVWLACEMSAMALVYTLIAGLLMPKSSGVVNGDLAVAFFIHSFFYIFFILLIPSILCWLYMALMNKKKVLQDLEQQYKETSYSLADQPSVLQFCDEKGEPKFSVKSENVIWIEAADNYVVIKYRNNEKISEYLLRNSLKHLAEDFKETTLFRCHRSYMVNFIHAVALRKGSEGLIIELDVQPMKEIPVSKTYKEETSRAFMQYNNI